MPGKTTVDALMESRGMTREEALRGLLELSVQGLVEGEWDGDELVFNLTEEGGAVSDGPRAGEHGL